jgi:hypothetical protein
MAQNARSISSWISLVALSVSGFIVGGATLIEAPGFLVILTVSIVAIGIAALWRGTRLADATLRTQAVMASFFVSALAYLTAFALGRLEVSVFGPRLIEYAIGGTLSMIVSLFYWSVEYRVPVMAMAIAIFCLLSRDDIIAMFHRRSK